MTTLWPKVFSGQRNALIHLALLRLGMELETHLRIHRGALKLPAQTIRRKSRLRRKSGGVAVYSAYRNDCFFVISYPNLANCLTLMPIGARNTRFYRVALEILNL